MCNYSKCCADREDDEENVNEEPVTSQKEIEASKQEKKDPVEEKLDTSEKPQSQSRVTRCMSGPFNNFVLKYNKFLLIGLTLLGIGSVIVAT